MVGAPAGRRTARGAGETIAPPLPAPTAIVADTTSYLPTDLIERHAINLISLYVGIEGKHEREADISDYEDFYERLRRSSEPVTTSQPSIGDFTSVYEPLLGEDREIVSIHLSSGISGTVEAANQAKERLKSEGVGGERIQIFDSTTAAGGTGLLVLAAAAAAESGAGAAEIAERLGAAREKLKIWFAVDSLEYLRRGGRIGGAQAWIGSTLKIKPILTLEKEIEPVERVRTRKRAFARLVDYARQRHGDGADGWVVQHVTDPEGAEEVVEACKPVFGCDPAIVSEIGPVLGAHIGPGLVGVGAVPREFLEA